MERDTVRGLMARLPTGWAAALVGSIALHGLVLAAIIGAGQPDPTEPPEPMPIVAYTIVAEAPPGAGRPATSTGASRPQAGSAARRPEAPKPASKVDRPRPVTEPLRKPSPAEAPTPAPEMRVPPPATSARRIAAERDLRRRPAPVETVRISVRAKPKPKPKPPISPAARRAAAKAARHKFDRKRAPKTAPALAAARPSNPSTPSNAQIAFRGTGAAAVYRPPRPGGGGSGNAMPRYPEDARERGAEGRVVLEVSVDEAGHARAVRVRKSSGEDDLDRAALEAVRRWRFTPARRGGAVVAGTAVVPIRFRLVAE